MATNNNKADRDARLAAALRANLRRRKVLPPDATSVPDAPPDGGNEPAD